MKARTHAVAGLCGRLGASSIEATSSLPVPAVLSQGGLAVAGPTACRTILQDCEYDSEEAGAAASGGVGLACAMWKHTAQRAGSDAQGVCGSIPRTEDLR